MLSILPIAAVIALFVAAKGRPWHAVMGLTLGVYLFQALLAAILHGTGGFMDVVEQRSWWIPALGFGAIALVTGVPRLRRIVMRSGSHTDTTARASGDSSHSFNQPAPWETLIHETGGWEGAIGAVASLSQLSGADLLRDGSSLEHGTSGALGEATRRVNAGLETIDSTAADGRLDHAWYRAIHDLTDGDAHVAGLNGRDRIELISRAASLSLDAGQTLGAALPVHHSASLRGLAEALGTEDQQSPEFLAPFVAPGATAIGWTGIARAAGRITEENHGRGAVHGLRIRFNGEGIAGAQAATWVLLDVETYNANDAYLGRSAVLVPTGAIQKSRSKGGKDQSAKLQASCTAVGSLSADDVFVPLSQVLGERDGLGAAGQVLDTAKAHYTSVTSALFAGSAQRALAIRGAEAIAMNVMHGATIEAWSHAMTGAAVWKLNALAESAAWIGEERPLSRFEAESTAASAARITAEIIESSAGEAAAGADRDPIAPSDAAAHAMAQQILTAHQGLAFTTPSMRDSAAATSPAKLEAAASDGLRSALTTWAWLTKERVLRKLPGTLGSAQRGPIDAGNRLVAALSAISSSADRERGSDSAATVQAALERASQHIFTATIVAWADIKRDRQPIERDLVEFALRSEFEGALRELQAAGEGLKSRVARAAARGCVRSLSASAPGLTPELAERVATAMIANPEILRRLTRFTFRSENANSEISRVYAVAKLSSGSRVPAAAIRRAQSVGQLPNGEFTEALDLAVERRIVSTVDVARIRACMAAMENLWDGALGGQHRLSA